MRLSDYVSLLIVTGSVALLAAEGSLDSHKNNYLTGFRYTACSKAECIQLTAPQAWLSFSGEGFTTSGTTRLAVLDLSGNVKSMHEGEGASFNPSLNIITLEGESLGLVLYSVSDSKLSVYGRFGDRLGGQQ